MKLAHKNGFFIIIKKSVTNGEMYAIIVSIHHYERKNSMNYEKSCGAIVYRKHYGNTEILLIKHVKSGYWSFPKGHVEDGESETQTAVREIKEETNIDISIDDSSFRETVMFTPRRDTRKEVVYFVARATSFDLKPQEEEISEIRWVEIGQAGSHLAYDNDKLIVNKVRAFLAKSKI